MEQCDKIAPKKEHESTLPVDSFFSLGLVLYRTFRVVDTDSKPPDLCGLPGRGVAEDQAGNPSGWRVQQPQAGFIPVGGLPPLGSSNISPENELEVA